MITPDPQYLTVAEAAQRLGVSSKTLRRRVADGTVPCYRVGRLLRLRADELDAALRRVPAA